MPISEQRIKALEENVHELETRTSIGAHNLDLLAERVENISQSLTRLEETIGDFLQFWQTFLSFLRQAIVWALGLASTVIGSFIVWYLTTHVMH